MFSSQKNTRKQHFSIILRNYLAIISCTTSLWVIQYQQTIRLAIHCDAHSLDTIQYMVLTAGLHCTGTSWCSNVSPYPWKWKNISKIIFVKSSPQKLKRLLTDSCQHNSWYAISACCQLQLDQWDMTGTHCCVCPNSFSKTQDFILSTTDPSMPHFPTPAWPNPLFRSVWTCSVEPPAPSVLSRRHTMLALSLLTGLDYS